VIRDCAINHWRIESHLRKLMQAKADKSAKVSK